MFVQEVWDQDVDKTTILYHAMITVIWVGLVLMIYIVVDPLNHQWTSQTNNPANTMHFPNVVMMLARRLRRRSNIKTTLGKCLVFDGNTLSDHKGTTIQSPVEEVRGGWAEINIIRLIFVK